MIAQIFAIRPEPGLSATVGGAKALGLQVIGSQLFTIGPVSWDPPAADNFGGLLIGSANAIRHAGEGLALYSGLDVYAVGAATAREAEKAGFGVKAVGEGSLQALLDSLTTARLKLLRLAGAEHVPLDPPANVRIEKRIVYRTFPQKLPQSIADRLADGGIVMLHSAAAAAHFSEECSRLNVSKANIRIAALGPRIAAAAGAGWAGVHYADTPRETALLALVRDLCHEQG
ncbi:uroporphyrinogen-III synthase [Altererythrobacter sp. ZODW24]|uniref:uroporphyrinogen-III synthase n=1 Tax=Altererythrobacter sp. ZODW24 TaxID=2185142 RepID=UPI000DF72B20|nr:uroporphyrinogen-III synthase [Altererythrobacter sp. ZODW24]